MGKVVRWSEEDLKYLIENFNNGNKEEIVARLGRCWKTIRNKAYELGLKRNEELWKKGKPWTSDEIEYLKSNYGILSVDKIAKYLNRGRKSVTEKAYCLGITNNKCKPWTKEEEQYLAEKYSIENNSTLVKHLERSEYSIVLKAKEMGLEKQKMRKVKEKPIKKQPSLKKWTIEEDDYIKEHYPCKDTALVAETLGRTRLSVERRASFLGVKKDFGWTEKDEELLRHLYLETDMSLADISKKLNRTQSSVSGKIYCLGIYRRGKVEPWTTKQIKYLKDNFGIKTRVRIAAELGKTPGAVSAYATKNGIKPKKISYKKIKKRNGRLWEDWEVSYLLENYDTVHWTKMKRVLKRSKKSIIGKMQKLGIWNKAIKKHVGTTFTFYYRTDKEKEEKLDYILWWRDVLYGKCCSESEGSRITT